MNENKKTNLRAGAVELDLWEIITLLLRKIHWLLLAGVLVGAATYIGVMLFVAPTYQSRVSFYVYSSSDKVSQTQIGTVSNADLQAAGSLTTTYAKILGSNTVLDAVLEDLGEDSDLTRAQLSSMVSTSAVTDAQLLEVVVTSTDAALACKVASSFIQAAPAEIIRITKAGSVEVVDRPEVATSQSTPRTLRDGMIGFMIGVVLCAGVFILRMMMDSTIYLPEDIEKTVGLTVLGQIPEIDAAEENTTGWKLVEGGRVRYGEKE